MDAPTQYPSAPPEPIAPIPGSVASGDDKPPTGEGKLSRHLHGHVPLSPGGTKLSGAVYLSDSHRAMLQALVFRMTEGGTWIAITGPAQIGKTILVQAALTLLPQDKLRLFQVRHFGPGPLSLKSVLSQILDTAETDTVTSRDLDRANESLFLSSARGGHAVLLIDDAQDLAADALRYLLALASHPEAAKLHLQVVLVGRPDLWTTLQHQEFKPLRDKLALRLTLDRLRPGEDHSYVERRLWVVGTSIRKAITQPALQEIVRFGAGVPGNIDQLLDQAAELRRQRGESRITVRTARAAVAMLSGAEPTKSYQSLWMAGAGTFLVFACAIAFYVLLTPVFQSGGPFSPTPPPSAPTAPSPPAQATANTTPPAPAATSAPADSKPAPAPPEGAAGPTKLADTNLAALDGNQPPASGETPSVQTKPDQPAGTTEALAGSQQQPNPEPVPEPPSQQQSAGEKAAAAPPVAAPPVQESRKAPAVQQSSEPGAASPTEPEADKSPTNPPPGSPAQQQSAEPPQPVELAPAEQTAVAPVTPEPAPKAEEQTHDQPEPVTQEATPSAPPAGSAQSDQKPVELAASRPMPAPPPEQPAPTPQSEATTPPSASQKLSPDIIAALIRRGDAMLATGDISAARLLYRPAAEAGSGPAAAALGRSFDPAFLASSGVIGIQPDPEAAAKWYRKAASLGEPGMEDAIKRLEVVPAAANSSGGR